MPIVSLDQFLARSDSQNSPFDYLILGGGTAGLVIAHRLTRNPNITVGVIEAGVYHGPSGTNPIIDTPGFIGRTLNNPLYDWAFRTIPQQYANNRTIPLPRGKGIGGSSIINYLGLTRPSKDEYDALTTSFNNRGWTWNKLLDCMKRSERFIQYETLESRRRTAIPGSYIPTPILSVHGSNGAIHHSHPPSWPPHLLTETESETKSLNEFFFQSMKNIGVPENPEPCGGYNIGYAKPLMTINPHTGMRSSSSSGYFESIIENTPNLLVLTETIITRILFDHIGNSGELKAVGAELYLPIHNKYTEIRNIQCEIILSTGYSVHSAPDLKLLLNTGSVLTSDLMYSGSLKTPEILECSGIGDSTILTQHGINCLIDLPGVGRNLQDHASVSVIVEVSQDYVTSDLLLDPEQLTKHQKLLNEKKEGLLADSPSQGFSFLSFQHISRITGITLDEKQLNAQNQKYINNFLPPGPIHRGYEKQCQLQTKWLSDPNQAQIEIINFTGYLPINILAPAPAPGKRYLTLTASLMHPFSRGTVHHTPSITPSNEIPHPIIDLNLISHPMDRTLLLQGLECIIHLTQTEPLKGAIKSWIFPPQLSTINLEAALRSSNSDTNHTLKVQLKDILEEYSRENVRTIYHPVGTAAMMSREDGGVVDERLRVYGVKGLRVEISSHTVSAAYAIGEMASELLLEDYMTYGRG